LAVSVFQREFQGFQGGFLQLKIVTLPKSAQNIMKLTHISV
jgi:hypothetical protein